MNSIVMVEDNSDDIPYQSDTNIQGNPVTWTVLVQKVKDCDEDGMAQLYSIFGTGIRRYLNRQLGTHDLEDKLHDVFVIVVAAIRRGDVREPERLMGFVRTIAVRQVAGEIDKLVSERKRRANFDDTLRVSDQSGTPEDAMLRANRTQLMQKALKTLSSREREILTRFYIEEQSQMQICAEMNLTDTQFRLLKSRSKAKFGDMGRSVLERRTHGFFARSLSVFRHES